MGRTYNYDVDGSRTCACCGRTANRMKWGDTFELLKGEHITESGYLVEVSEPLWEAEDCSSSERISVVLCGEAHPGARANGCINNWGGDGTGLHEGADRFLYNERMILAYGV